MTSDEAVRAAAGLLAAGQMADQAARRQGRVERAIPVEHPRGQVRSWFVPVTAADRLLGFFELTPALVPLRYSGFPAPPLAAAWLDPKRIRRKAAALLRPGERAGQPYLSYDAVPARLAWAVPCASPDGATRLVFVAGDAVFPASPAGAESSTGTG